jgi:hypothetical protein
MAVYHFSLGMWMRNNWGLWHGSRLSEYFNEHGVHHPDDMSGIILSSYWNSLHNLPMEFEKQCRLAAQAEERSKRFQMEEERRAQELTKKIPQLMMNIRPMRNNVDTIILKNRLNAGLCNRYFSSYGHGVILSVYAFQGQQNDFINVPYYFDYSDSKLHKLSIAEIDSPSSVVVIGSSLYRGQNE